MYYCYIINLDCKCRLLTVLTNFIVVYRCARGNVFTATGDCMVYTNQVNVDKLIEDADVYEAEGLVDDLTGLQGSKVYVFHGTNDGTVGERK